MKMSETMHDVTKEFLGGRDGVSGGVACCRVRAHENLAIRERDDIRRCGIMEEIAVDACNGGIIHHGDLDALEGAEDVLRSGRSGEQSSNKPGHHQADIVQPPRCDPARMFVQIDFNLGEHSDETSAVSLV